MLTDKRLSDFFVLTTEKAKVNIPQRAPLEIVTDEPYPLQNLQGPHRLPFPKDAIIPLNSSNYNRRGY